MHNVKSQLLLLFDCWEEQSKLCELQVQTFFNRYRKVSGFYNVKSWSLSIGHFDFRMGSFFWKQSSWKNYFHRLFQNCIIDNPSAKIWKYLLETINIIYFAIISFYVM